MGARCSDYYQITMRNATLQSVCIPIFIQISKQYNQNIYLFIVELMLTLFAVYSLTESCGAVMEFSCRLKEMNFKYFQIRWPCVACPGTLFLGSFVGLAISEDTR